MALSPHSLWLRELMVMPGRWGQTGHWPHKIELDKASIKWGSWWLESPGHPQIHSWALEFAVLMGAEVCSPRLGPEGLASSVTEVTDLRGHFLRDLGGKDLTLYILPPGQPPEPLGEHLDVPAGLFLCL